MSVEEAHFAARRAFGGEVEQMKERQRDARSFRVLDQSWLDVKLAVRMLIRYPGLTVVSVLGMSVAIAIAAGAFSIVDGLLDPTLPLDEGNRIVAIQNWDIAKNNAEGRLLHDFVTWREELTSVDDVGAFLQVERNLIATGTQPEVVRVAEVSASAFRVTRVAPLLGRYLLDEDEREGAAPVVVIGRDVWKTRFASDPNIVGRPLQLGATTYSIVGVMEAIRALAAAELLSAERGHRPLRGGAMDVVALLSLGDWPTAERFLSDNRSAVETGGVLHMMAKRNHVAAVKWLLDHGADPNLRWAHWDADVTPLHLAALQGHTEVARLLLAGGADASIRDSKHDGDAIGWAEHFGRREIVQLIENYRSARGGGRPGGGA